MTLRSLLIATGLVGAIVAGGLVVAKAGGPVVADASTTSQAVRFEVWIADQSDTRAGFGGQILIYQGADLTGANAAQAKPAQIDLGAETADICRASTGTNPVRPHMILFNREHTHAVLSFVASGHVAIFDAAARKPLTCVQTSVSESTKTRQAHAAFPAPDGSYILVANQNGKRLERIDTNYAKNTFSHNAAATLDLATCTTPGGRPCESADLRPMNWPICPIIDSSSRYGFVTLRGGGLFVVDAKATPMTIAGEYDKATVHGNGCGGVEVGNAMYLNSGGSPVNVSGGDPKHSALYGFDVYRFPLTGYSGKNAANTPAPTQLFAKTGAADSHGIAATANGRFLWVMDRHNDVAEIIEIASGKHVNTVNLNGALTANAAPDLVDTAPGGTRLFVALRGPVPLSGDPHNAVGATPGLGIIEVADNGRTGSLAAIVRITNPSQQDKQQPDPHGLRVRIVR